jgi:hypothetical protein
MSNMLMSALRAWQIPAGVAVSERAAFIRAKKSRSHPLADLVVPVYGTDDGKTGPCAVTWTAQVSCPGYRDTDPHPCALYNAGCYAGEGHCAFTTRRVNTAALGAGGLQVDPADVADAEAQAIRIMSMYAALPLRIHIVGDCITDYAADTVASAAMEYHAVHSAPVWSYTHAWRSVARASWHGVSILASCDTLDDIPAAKSAGYATALVVDEFATNDAGRPVPSALPDGGTLVPCPNQVAKALGKDTVTCMDCRLCWMDDFLKEKNLTIGFAAHGGKTKLIQMRIRRAGESVGEISLLS